MKKLGFIVIIILLTTPFIYAEINSNVFGNYQPSARARGMSGAFVASCNDPNAIFYNPGALANSEQGISLGYALAFLTIAFKSSCPVLLPTGYPALERSLWECRQ